MKTFLLVYPADPNDLLFGSRLLERDPIASEVAEKAPGVEEVYDFFGNAMCIRSTGSLRELHEFLKDRFKSLEFFLVEIGESKAGSMDASFWEFLREKALEKPAA